MPDDSNPSTTDNRRGSSSPLPQPRPNSEPEGAGDGGGERDEYGFSNVVDSSAGSGRPKEELVDLELLAQHLYELLRREALVERERRGIR